MPPNAVLRVGRKANKQGHESAPLCQMRFLEARCHILACNHCNFKILLLCMCCGFIWWAQLTIACSPFMQNFHHHKLGSGEFVLWLFMKCHQKTVTLLDGQAPCRKLGWISSLKGTVVMAHGTPFMVPEQAIQTMTNPIELYNNIIIKELYYSVCGVSMVSTEEKNRKRG